MLQNEEQPGIESEHRSTVPSTGGGRKRPATKPSTYIKERLLSTADRLALPTSHQNQIIGFTDLAEVNQRDFRVPIDQPIFKPSPSEVVLQNFVPFQTYEVLISFRNMDKFARKLHVEAIENPLFTIHEWKSHSLNSGRVASGMEVQFVLKFTPTEDKDCTYNLVCASDREKFIVPIRAIGSRALVDFPDEIVFGQCAVRYESKKTLLVRNIGTRPAKYEVQCSGPFRVEPAQGFLGIQGTKQVEVYFAPMKTGSYEDYMKISYDTGETVTARLSGISENVLVKLSSRHLNLENAYISLSSWKTIKIINRSNIMCQFTWKTFANENEERQCRDQAVTKLAFEEKSFRQEKNSNKDQDQVGATVALLDRKFMNLRNLIEHDRLLFTNNVFSVEPMEGVVWPNSEVDVAVMFRPTKAGMYQETLFCEITGRETRLPLQISAESFGPRAQFSFEVLDIGNNFINSVRHYEVYMENIGDIDAHYMLIPLNSTFASKFTFTPSTGVLKVGQKQTIDIQFNCNILGRFQEEFVWELEGSPDPVVFGIKGHVVGPTFHFDCDNINFGKCPFNFRSSRNIILKNTSSVSMDFRLSYHDQSPREKKESLVLEPSAGRLQPNEARQVTVSICPEAIGKYSGDISVAIGGVGEKLMQLPVKAESVVPTILLKQSMLELGNCFVGYRYTKKIELINNTDFAAKFWVVDQPEEDRGSFEFNAAADLGNKIEPGSIKSIDISIQLKRLGQVDFPIYVVICGREEVPLVMDVSARGIGPRVHLLPQEMSWDNTPVLEEKTMQLTLHNDSLIAATFDCKMVSESSVFTVSPQTGTIAPGAIQAVEVAAFLDDTVQFNDLLNVAVHGTVHTVPLMAKGVGTTIRIDDLNDVHFNNVFSNQECRRVFTVANKGRRTQTLIWTHQDGKRESVKLGGPTTVPIFQLRPGRLTLRPGESHELELIGYSASAQTAKETITCLAYYEKNPTKRKIMQAEISATFVDPVISHTPEMLHFIANDYKFDGPELVKTIEITNVTDLPLNMSLRTSPPFSIENFKPSYSLAPKEIATIRVTFRADENSILKSPKQTGKLYISFRDHPQKTSVSLIGEYRFPSLNLKPAVLDFGSTVPGGDAYRALTLVNTGELPVEYFWTFEAAAASGLTHSELEELNATVAQTFDLLPIRGSIFPGKDQSVTVRYCGDYGQLRAKAVCHVISGPKYELQLQGTIAPVQFTVDKSTLDFGKRPFAEILTQELLLTNTGEVAFDFRIEIPSDSKLDHKMAVVGGEGTLAPHEKRLIAARLCVGVPEKIDTEIFLRVAHCEAKPIKIIAVGVAPSCRIDLPKQMTQEQIEVKRQEEVDLKFIEAKLPRLAQLDVPDWRPFYMDVNGANSVAFRENRHVVLANEATMARLAIEATKKLKTQGHPVSFVGSPLLFSRGFPLQKGKKGSQNIAELSKAVVEKYVCDFGHVIRNTKQSRTFKITNTGELPANISIDRNALANSGFSVANEKIKCLPPHETHDIEVTFNSRQVCESGSIVTAMHVDVAGGLALLVELRADIVVPDLQLSSNMVDFGTSIVGQRCTHFVQLFNPLPVECEWTLNADAVAFDDKTNSKEQKSNELFGAIFEVTETSGKLLAGERTNLGVRFLPAAARGYTITFSIQVNMNKKLHTIIVQGTGVQSGLTIDPQQLNITGVAPFETAERRVTFTNGLDIPIEFFSVDFDGQYLDEREILRTWDQYDAHNCAYIPPRQIGQSLPVGSTSKSSTVVAPNANNDIVSIDQTAAVHVEAIEQVVNVANGSPSVTNKADTEKLYLVVHGGPYSGKSTVAMKLAETYRVPTIRIDDLLEIAKKTEAHDPKKSDLNLSRTTKSDATHSVEAAMSEEALLDRLREQLNMFPKGFVVDGISSKLIPNTGSILKALADNAGTRARLHFFLLTLDPSQMRLRENAQEATKKAKDRAIRSCIKEIAEDEYDLLTEEARHKYDGVLDQMKLHRKTYLQKYDVRPQMKVDPKAAEDEKAKKRDKTRKKTKSTVKTTVGEKGGRKTERYDEDGQRIDGMDMDDLQALLGDGLFAQYESYMASLESLAAVFKDVEKITSHTLRQLASNLVPQDVKKQSKTKGPATLTNAEQHPSSVQLHVESDILISENGAPLKLRELNIFGNETSVYEEISISLPPPVKESTEDDGKSNALPEPFVEQIIIKPTVENRMDSDLAGTLSLSSTIEEPDDVSIATGSHVNVNRKSERQNRWVLQPKESRELTLKFAPVRVGSWTYGLRFEVLGFGGSHTLDCNLTCVYPTINTSHATLFARYRESRLAEGTLHPGEFIINSRVYDFGPLLCGKPKERGADGKNVENRANITIANPFSSEVKVHFFTKMDSKGDVFNVEPAFLDISPGQSANLGITAYPKQAGKFEEQIICCIRDNPEPFTFKVCCTAAKPELDLDKKTIAFDKVLLGRSETRELKLTNPTPLPVAWKLSGVDGLAEDFEIKPTEGIVPALSTSAIILKFQSTKPGTTKKNLRFEVFDPERVLGVSQTENITVLSEAYDVSIDIHFPRSNEGGVDFGTCRVDEEVKQICLLRNKGKYEIGYRFEVEWKDLANCLVITPSHGIVPPSEKPASVQILFKSNKEIAFKENTNMKCYILEPSNNNEVIGVVPVKASAKAVYSKFSILPARDLAFGASVIGSRATKTFVIDNSGEFDFKFSISKADKRQSEIVKDSLVRKEQNKHHSKREAGKMADNLVVGPFTVYPATGTVQPNSKQQITVEFHSEVTESFEEYIEIEISDRPSDESIRAIEYRLNGETCIPGINTLDYSSIFEEHTIVKKLEQFQHFNSIFAEDDRCFSFGPLLITTANQARFKLHNPFKVSCDVSIVIKSRNRGSNAEHLAFDVEPKKMTLMPHEYHHVTVTFHAQALAQYSATFEASVDAVLGSENKNRNLVFELRGEGTLPRVSAETPAAQNKARPPCLKFRRSLCGTKQTLPIILKNDGIITAKVKFEWTSPDIGTAFASQDLDVFHTIASGDTKTINISFLPTSIRKYDGELKLRILDNMFEDITLPLTGEGFKEDFAFNNLPYDGENEIRFGACRVGDTRTVVFQAANYSAETVRLVWNVTGDFTISPSIMHVRPHDSKDVTVSFCPKAPNETIQAKASCSISKIQYTAVPSIMDWDDRMKITRWHGEERSKSNRKHAEFYPEPAYELLAQLPEESLVISASADFPNFECEQGDISFKGTYMFQSRFVKFPLRNVGTVPLIYSFRFEDDGRTVTEDEDLPFSASPEKGVIEPGESTIISVRFAPANVAQYQFRLCCDTPGVTTKSAFSCIVSGISFRPVCHFELPDSDYLLTRRSTDDPDKVQLDPGTRAIEFETCGINSKAVKRFYIVNTTDSAYSFEWKCVDNNGAGTASSIFNCLTEKGVVQSGKKFEIVFEYVPDAIDTKESVWKFLIPAQNIDAPFVLVGFTSEPNVYFDKTSINFRSVLVGRQLKEVVNIKNMESTPFAFSFEGVNSARRDAAIQFVPSAGVIPPMGETPILVTFSPNTERSYNSNATCFVRKKPGALVLNVKGDGYQIHEKLSAELTDGSTFELVPGPGIDNVLDFGAVQINERKSKRITIYNRGKVTFDFRWNFESKKNPCLSISPEVGSVGKDERVVCDLVFLPTLPIHLKPSRVLCSVTNGPSYPVSVYGTGRKPPLRMSTSEYDFGPIFIGAGANLVSEQITLKNEDTKIMTIAVSVKENSCFEVMCGSSTLQPGEETKLSLRFEPKAVVKYMETVRIEVNGLSKLDLTLKGEGAEFKVVLGTLGDRIINFGPVRVGHSAQKTVQIVNKSIIPASFQIGPPGVRERLKALDILVTLNDSEMTLLPKGTYSFDVRYNPRKRLPQFSEELFIQTTGIRKPLLTISGSCQGTEVKLESNTIAFGAVAHRSSTSRKLQIVNTGDIGVRFRWDVSQFLPDFMISPSEGYISAGMDASVEIEFNPVEVKPDIRYEKLACEIEGAKKLLLTLTGSCIVPPSQNEILRFATPVRQSETKSITLANKSSVFWHIRPIIDGAYWTGKEVVEVEPGQTQQYEIVYTPLEMTVDNARHEGSLFFPLPDGSGILYKLSGLADKPSPEGSISRDVVCKTLHFEQLKVCNWLKRPQRFHVTFEMLKPDPSTVVKGVEFFDVPPQASRDYKLSIYAYRESVTNLKVWFRNDQTQEYAVYMLSFKATSPGVLDVIELTTPVRRQLAHEISIENPLAVPVGFTSSVNSQDLVVPHSFTVQPKSTFRCTLDFMPLHVKEYTTRLSLFSNELGAYHYDVKLNSTTPNPERSIHFKVGLGGSQTQVLRFISYSKVKVEYSCRLDCADFSVEKTITSPAATSTAGAEVSMEITYEPSKLGDVRTTLYISSNVGGDYICPLFGHCSTPKPQGPVLIKQGSTNTSISFKNVFTTSSTFSFSIDNPSFVIKPTENIPPKKSVNAVISYKPLNNIKTAKLTVSHQSGAVWIYYIKNNN